MLFIPIPAENIDFHRIRCDIASSVLSNQVRLWTWAAKVVRFVIK